MRGTEGQESYKPRPSLAKHSKKNSIFPAMPPETETENAGRIKSQMGSQDENAMTEHGGD